LPLNPLASGLLVINLTVIFFSIRQWVTGIGSLNARLRYSALAMAAIVYLWVAYYFNFFCVYDCLMKEPITQDRILSGNCIRVPWHLVRLLLTLQRNLRYQNHLCPK